MVLGVMIALHMSKTFGMLTHHPVKQLKNIGAFEAYLLKMFVLADMRITQSSTSIVAPTPTISDTVFSFQEVNKRVLQTLFIVSVTDASDSY